MKEVKYSSILWIDLSRDEMFKRVRNHFKKQESLKMCHKIMKNRKQD